MQDLILKGLNFCAKHYDVLLGAVLKLKEHPKLLLALSVVAVGAFVIVQL